MRFKVTAFIFVIFAALVALAWASDSITLQGDRTIYTARCVNGEWRGDDCAGHLVTAERYRYLALRAHREVMFWIAGSSEPSGRFSDCEIQDGRNWKCPPGPDASKSITLQMSQGRAVPDPDRRTRAFHAVPKWEWMLLPDEG